MGKSYTKWYAAHVAWRERQKAAKQAAKTASASVAQSRRSTPATTTEKPARTRTATPRAPKQPTLASQRAELRQHDAEIARLNQELTDIANGRKGAGSAFSHAYKALKEEQAKREQLLAGLTPERRAQVEGGQKAKAPRAATSAGAKAAKSPEEQHAEKVTRAEEQVAKARAAHEEARATYERAVAHGRASTAERAEMDAATRLHSAETRLANLKKQAAKNAYGPIETPESRAASIRGGIADTQRLIEDITAGRQYAGMTPEERANALEGLRASVQHQQETLAHETTPARAARTGGTRTRAPREPTVTYLPPMKETGKPFNPLAKADPFDMAEAFGHGEFARRLRGASQKVLREMVGTVQERYPGTKPRSRSRNQDMIDYIVQHVGGGEGA